MDKRKDRWANGWSKAEDSLLWEAIEYTGTGHKKAWYWFKEHGGSRNYYAFKNRRSYLFSKEKTVESNAELPKGWGLYV